ncbi:MAG: hypothetical protein ACLQF1_13080 [Methyloceanibacter sp.]
MGKMLTFGFASRMKLSARSSISTLSSELWLGVSYAGQFANDLQDNAVKGLSFPKIPSGVDSHHKAESSHPY